MKIFARVIFILVLVSLVTCRPNTPTTTLDGEPKEVATESVSTPAPTSLAPTAWADRPIFGQGLIEAEQEVLDHLPGASVYHLDFQIPDDFLRLIGHEEVRYTNRENEPLDEIYFRLFPNTAGGKATVSAVKVDDQEVEPVYEFEDSALRVPLPLALQPGEQVNIQMDFEVEVAREMAGNYGLFGYFDGVLVLDEFYPAIPVYDDEGWNVEMPPPNADATYFDASFYRVRVTAPTSLTIVASGIEVDREDETDSQILTFAAGPARDFYLAASENYTVISKTVGETVVNSYAFPERMEGAELTLQIAVEALKSFSERFGPYPYTEFDVLSTPMQALGIEYPGIVGISLALYDPNERILGLPSRVILESTVAHEVAHQWFYNTVGNDQIDEPWLDEALAQYATWLYYVDVYGEGVAQDYRDSWNERWDRVERADIPIGLPAGTYVDNEYGAIVYGRGPLFLTTLADKMGQESFDEFLRDYYESHKWGIGTSETFKQLAEQHCQCDLTTLFEEWVYPK
jgi:aminopeptidase N